jgi:hypothetical protein
MEFRARNLCNAIGSAVCQQLILFAIAFALLDGNVAAQICGFAVAAFWIGVALIYLRRRSALTRMDLLFVEAATVPLVVATAFLSFAIARARGVY